MAMVAALTLGNFKVSQWLYAACGVSSVARAEGSVTFDEATGTLTLSGEVSYDAVRAYAGNQAVKTVYAKRGTILPSSCANLFDGFCAKSMDLSRANTSNVDDMIEMFRECKNLKTLDISNFDVSNVTSFYRMF